MVINKGFKLELIATIARNKKICNNYFNLQKSERFCKT